MKVVVIPTAAALLLLACGNRENAPSGSGFIETTEVTYSSQTTGQLEAIYYVEGQSVNVGDTLAMIDTTNVMLRLRQAQAAGEAAATRLQIAAINVKQAANNLELANKEYDRISSLIKTGSANQQQYDQAQTAHIQAQLAQQQSQALRRAASADLSNARAQIALLEKQVSDCFPVAPLNGTIIDKFVEPGELITVNKPLIKIDRLDTVWVKIYLPPRDLTRINLGEHAIVNPEDGRTKPLDGAITWISSEAEFTPKNVQTKEARAGLLYAVKITIPNPDHILKIGMPVFVTIQ
jgi:HlyD family secretion protein